MGQVLNAAGTQAATFTAVFAAPSCASQKVVLFRPREGVRSRPTTAAHSAAPALLQCIYKKSMSSSSKGGLQMAATTTVNLAAPLSAPRETRIASLSSSASNATIRRYRMAHAKQECHPPEVHTLPYGNRALDWFNTLPY